MPPKYEPGMPSLRLLFFWDDRNKKWEIVARLAGNQVRRLTLKVDAQAPMDAVAAQYLMAACRDVLEELLPY